MNSTPPSRGFEVPTADFTMRVTRTTWIALALISATHFLNYVDRLLVAVVGVNIKAEFALSDTEFGILTGLAFTVLYAVASIFAGWLADRSPRHTMMAVALAVWSSATLVCGVATNYISLVLARAAVGIGEAGFVPAAYSFLSEKFPPHRRTFAFAVLYTFGAEGVLGAFALGATIAVDYGWRAAFLFAGVPGLIIALLVYLLLEEPRKHIVRTGNSSFAEFKASYSYLINNRPYMIIAIGAGLSTFSSYGILSWLPMFFTRSHGFDLGATSKLLMMTMTIGMVLSTIVAAPIANVLVKKSLWRPLLLSVWVNVIIPPVFWLILLLPSADAAIALTAVGGFLGVFFTPMYMGTIQNCCHGDHRASASALSTVLSVGLGVGVLTFVVGVLSDVGAPFFGADSLRYALAIAISVNLITAAMFFKAYKILAKG